jgi:hypothetical protein
MRLWAFNTGHRANVEPDALDPEQSSSALNPQVDLIAQGCKVNLA